MINLYERIYLAIMQIPAGNVASYGDIATIVGNGCDARIVGDALADLSAKRALLLPWQRVVNREGAISTRGLQQRDVLEAEGVAFDTQGRVVMQRHRWKGPHADWAEAHGFQMLPNREDAEQLSLF